MTPTDPPARTVELSRGAVAYREEGDGPAVVLIHGLPGSARDFRHLAPRIAAAHRVVRVDLPGFGETPVARWGVTPRDQALLVRALMDALSIPYALVVGHSAGGYYACALAMMAPDRVRGVALLASNGVSPHRALRRAPMATFARLLDAAVTSRMIMPLLRRGFRRAGFRAIDDVALARTVRMVAAALASDHAENARAMTQPCLVAHAEDDALVEVEIARELAAVVPDGPRLWFDSGGHALPKTRAVPIAQALIDWYPSLLPRTRANKA